MKKQTLILFSAIIFLSSCSFFRNITSRDNSTPQQNSSQKQNNNPRFLNNISVAPGGMVPNYSSAQTPNHKEVYAPPPILYTGINIENVDSLQIKYAIIFDATVEQLLNVNLLRELNHWWATPYCYGGSTESCIDCSAFTQTVMRTVYGINVPRTAQQQFDNSKKINITELREGDLVFFHTGGADISHVGIYLLNNKFVHASTSSGVTVSDLNDGYWQPKFVGAGRFGK
jgi:lipoprotein Spr